MPVLLIGGAQTPSVANATLASGRQNQTPRIPIPSVFPQPNGAGPLPARPAIQTNSGFRPGEVKTLLRYQLQLGPLVSRARPPRCQPTEAACAVCRRGCRRANHQAPHPGIQPQEVRQGRPLSRLQCPFQQRWMSEPYGCTVASNNAAGASSGHHSTATCVIETCPYASIPDVDAEKFNGPPEDTTGKLHFVL